MDALKNFAKKAQTGTSGTSNTAPAAGAQKDDYGDKAASFLNKKYNNDKLDRSQLEKITDGAREGLEKLTGKQAPNKFSN